MPFLSRQIAYYMNFDSPNLSSDSLVIIGVLKKKKLLKLLFFYQLDAPIANSNSAKFSTKTKFSFILKSRITQESHLTLA